MSAIEPANRRSQDIGLARPAAASDKAAWKPLSDGSNGVRLAWPALMPSAIRPSALSRPRRLGSAASWPRKGWASTVWSNRVPSGPASRNSRPLRSK